MEPARIQTSGEDRRREPRDNCEFPIEVSGFNLGGEFFTEQTTTLDVSPCGCRFVLRMPVETQSVVAIRSLLATKPDRQLPTVLFQIVHITAVRTAWIVGASRLHTATDSFGDLRSGTKEEKPES